MRIIKKINTSAAIALDSAGNEIVVLGKGIGFPPVPYELKDLSVIERTFYDVNSRYFGMIKDLPKPILIASAEIAELAENNLDADLNPNLPFTLADHLTFAVERLKKGMDLTGAIAYDITHLYPKEAKLGQEGLEILKRQANITLPQSEAVSIAMHLINAESKVDDIASVMKVMKIISEIDHIVENKLKLNLDKESYEYSRFIAHVRYLIQRLSLGEAVETENENILQTLANQYPQIAQCADEIVNYLEGTWGWKCNDDEKLYLMLHIKRVQH